MFNFFTNDFRAKKSYNMFANDYILEDKLKSANESCKFMNEIIKP